MSGRQPQCRHSMPSDSPHWPWPACRPRRSPPWCRGRSSPWPRCRGHSPRWSRPHRPSWGPCPAPGWDGFLWARPPCWSRRTPTSGGLSGPPAGSRPRPQTCTSCPAAIRRSDLLPTTKTTLVASPVVNCHSVARTLRVHYWELSSSSSQWEWCSSRRDLKQTNISQSFSSHLTHCYLLGRTSVRRSSQNCYL